MINEENCGFYLQYLVKITEEKGISYDEIPEEYIKYFTIPGLEQALNISFPVPPLNWSEVEKYIDSNTFMDFNSLYQGISTKFENLTDKLYASYYFITHNIAYNKNRNQYSDRNSVSFDEIIADKKGIEKDYYSLFFELAKRFGISSKSIYVTKFHDSMTYSNRKNPPNQPNFEYQTFFIEVDSVPFIINPFEGAETDKYEKKREIFGKFYFLIPYSRFLTSYFPEKMFQNYNFTWEQFKLLNHTVTSKEVSFESSPFEFLNAKDGTVTFYFSCLPPSKDLRAGTKHKEGDEWKSKSLGNYLTFKCLNKNVKNRLFSGKPELKRERYVLKAKFPEKGEWLVFIDEGYSDFINFKCKVENPIEIPREIKGSSKSTVNFTPIVPNGGFTELNKRYARIRFSIKKKYSDLLIKLFKADRESLKEEGEEINESDFHCSTFTLEFPFKLPSESEDLVEEWILVSFPDDGCWMVNIWFNKEGTRYMYGVDYFFDVKGEKANITSPIFDVPKSRTFSSMDSSKPDEIWAIPNSSIVVVKGLKTTFHVFSKKNVSVYFSRCESEIELTEISEKPTDKSGIFDREFSANFTQYGSYNLIIESSSTWNQKYCVVENDLLEETKEEASLMNNFKGSFEDGNEDVDDIPLEIKNNVEKMLKNAVTQNSERKKRETKEREKIEKEKKEEKEKEKLKRQKQREKEDQEAREMFELEDKEELKRRSKLDELEKYEREAREKREKDMKKLSKSRLGKSAQNQNQDPKEIETLNKKIESLEKEKENLKKRFIEMERKEKEMKEKFDKDIQKLQNEWSTKDQEFIGQMKLKAEKRQRENEEFSQQEKSKHKKKIDELSSKIAEIENTMKEGKDKKQKIVSLQEEIVNEERDEFVILSSRQEKLEREQKQDEKLINERIKENEKNDSDVEESEEESLEKIKKKYTREEKSLPPRIKNQTLTDNQNDKRSQSQLNSKETKSKTCLLI
ncbi:hypothetical protein M9Y10_035662 [Tritrichomonas musculus]|uniref:Transglutaminase-like domain-containing protein n=1 Tax=Tritrichomonas musculus TaxID=1915356 RepID=A0ABR2GXF0_9EUKA